MSMRQLERSVSKSGGSQRPHRWAFIVVYGLTDEEALKLAGLGEAEQEKVELGSNMVYLTKGPSCWDCDGEYAKVGDKACPGGKRR